MIKPYYQDDLVTLYHADCREVLPKLEPVDFIFADPPYGHNTNNGDLIHRWEAALGISKTKAESRPIANDGPEANEIAHWFFSEANRLLRHGGCCCCCCCGGGGPDPQFARWALWMDEAIGFKHAVVWDKGGLGMGWHYRRNYEFVLVAEKKGARCKWYGGHSVANVVRIPKVIPRKTDHPTPKPLELSAFFIRLHSLPGDIVLDPFAGAGSTLLAGMKLGRRMIGVEIEERYCEVTALRIEEAKRACA